MIGGEEGSYHVFDTFFLCRRSIDSVETSSNTFSTIKDADLKLLSHNSSALSLFLSYAS
ncbi:hypothetical protein Hanom_Chr17g01579861 [Helianthus anomalus]